MHFSILSYKTNQLAFIAKEKPADLRGLMNQDTLFFCRGDFGIGHDGINRALDGSF